MSSLDNSVCADKIIAICEELKALLSDNGAFTSYGLKLLAQMQRLSLQVGLDDERKDEEEITPADRERGVYFRTVRGNPIAFEIETEQPVGGQMKAFGEEESPRNLGENIVNALKTEENKAVFYSNTRRGESDEYANNNDGSTMGMLFAQAGIEEFDPRETNIIDLWKEASRIFAEQASGEVRVIARPPLREGNIFENVELPTLKKNPKVTRITMLNLDTGEVTVLFRRKK